MSESEYLCVEGLSVEVVDSVLRLTIDRQQARNAMTDVSMDGMLAALSRASRDDQLRAVLLTGAGEHFCSGFDIVGRNADEDAKPRTGSVQRRLPTHANRLISLLLEVQLPVVCAVRGWVVGLGAQLALVSDFTVTASDARFWYPFLQRGFTPDSGSTWLLPRVVGRARARELLLLGRRLSGAEAAEWGLAHVAVAPGEVASVAEELLARLAAGPTVAMGLTKSLLNAGESQDLPASLRAEAYAMELSSRSPDFREGMKAFVERRSPDFKGR